MSTVIEFFTEQHVEAVKAFNLRIAASDETLRFPESPVSERFGPRTGPPAYHQHFVALDGGDVRGGYILQPQTFTLDGHETMAASYQFPLSEGIIEKRYGLVGVMMLMDALKREPLLFALGMGGIDRPVASVFQRMKWSLFACPFYFKILHPFQFFRRIKHLRDRLSGRILAGALAFSGTGWLGIKAFQSTQKIRHKIPEGLRVERVERFATRADDMNAIWDQAKGIYAMIAVRDASALDILYGVYRPFHRVLVTREDRSIGWAVALDTPMKDNRYFGDMRVGSIIDCLAVPGDEKGVIAAAAQYLQGQGVDMIVTNQTHTRWCRACAENQFMKGPSNFVFGVSPRLAQELEPFDDRVGRVHMVRGDSDGLQNL
jgi:hypothetical protein